MPGTARLRPPVPYTSLTGKPARALPPPLAAARSEEVSKARLNRIRGVEQHDRLDEQLYQDFESEEAKKVGARAGGGRWDAMRCNVRQALGQGAAGELGSVVTCVGAGGCWVARVVKRGPLRGGGGGGGPQGHMVGGLGQDF